jgi:profilin
MKNNFSIRATTVFILLCLAINILSLTTQHQLSGWDSYLASLVEQSKDSTGKKHTGKAAIISLDGGALWYSLSSPNALQLTPAEAQKIAATMKSGDFTSFQANGIWVEGVKYQFLREDGKVAFAKKKDHGALTFQKSKSAVVIGHTSEGAQQGNTNKAVGVIADYLESVGM